MRDVRQLTSLGRKIEDGSFAIIDQEIGPHDFDPNSWQIIRRVIHSTADFEYKNLVAIHPEAIAAGIKALRHGCDILVDVKMITAGLSQERLSQYGCQVHCFISDDDVISEAKKNNSTRAIEAVKKAHKLGILDGCIMAIGNAPTALIEVAHYAAAGIAKPAVVIGVPVGFVSAAESKEEIMQSSVPYIVTKGRKGGSPIAVSILHALMYLEAEAKS